LRSASAITNSVRVLSLIPIWELRSEDIREIRLRDWSFSRVVSGFLGFLVLVVADVVVVVVGVVSFAMIAGWLVG